MLKVCALVCTVQTSCTHTPRVPADTHVSSDTSHRGGTRVTYPQEGHTHDRACVYVNPHVTPSGRGYPFCMALTETQVLEVHNSCVAGRQGRRSVWERRRFSKVDRLSKCAEQGGLGQPRGNEASWAWGGCHCALGLGWSVGSRQGRLWRPQRLGLVSASV